VLVLGFPGTKKVGLRTTMQHVTIATTEVNSDTGKSGLSTHVGGARFVMQQDCCDMLQAKQWRYYDKVVIQTAKGRMKGV
jgi:hypothetical protein